jgi:uncharacterized membrane protein (UPF0127 family)
MAGRFPHVRAVKFLPLVLLLLGLASGCRDGKSTAAASAATSAPPTLAPLQGYLPHAQPRLQTMKLFIGLKEINAELALKPVEIYTGMMWRTNMPDGEGMLFVFSDATPRAFYMRNTVVPLSLAYIDPDGVIQEIHDLQPRNEISVPSKAENIQYVLEVPQGWFARNQIVPGTVVRSQYGELKKIFSFKPLPR